MIEKITACVNASKNYAYTKATSIYELVLICIEKVNEVIDFVNGFQAELDSKEDSVNISGNRKLSESGNFTGSLNGTPVYSVLNDINKKLNLNGDFVGTWEGDTKAEIDALIINGQNLYQNVIDLITSNPELNIETIDGGFLANATLPVIEDLGLITELVTDEIDCGFFVYPCAC